MSRSLAALAAVVLAISCADAPTAPPSVDVRFVPNSSAAAYTGPQILISQIYGGGGNSGATLRNDFIELFNPGSTPVTITGWRIAYTSATGSSWAYTSLSGTIQPGGYYLIQQAAGTGGTANLPTPDATGSIPMSATAGKVVLVSDGTALSGTCPTAAPVVDRVAFGTSSGAGNCVPEWTSRTPAVSNTTAAIRGQNGCAFTGSPSADFTSGAPAPRNTASAAITPCDGGSTGPVAASVVVTPTTASLVDTVSTMVEVAQVTPAQGIAQVRAGIAQLASATGLNRGQTQSLLVKVNAAEASIQRGNVQAALGQLGALRNELQALVNSGRATELQIEVIELAVERVERATR